MEEIIAAILIIGDAIAHGHQMYIIIRDENTKGISTTSIILNCVSSIFVTFNLIILNGNYFLKDAWIYGITWQSMDAWSAVMQMATSSAFTSLLVITYGIFAEPREQFRSALLISITIVFQFTVFSACILYGGARIAGIIFGVTATIITIVAWIPQIWLLIRRNERGELSLFMILAHFLGAWLAVFFQAVLNGEEWSTWLSSAVMGLEQFFLLGLWVRARYSGN